MHAAIAGCFCAVLSLAAAAQTAAPRTLSQSEYRQRMRGMWLGQCIANWTGLQTEGRHRQPPFLTDADWGQPQPYTNGFPLEFKWFYNPWGADDDTDIEYVYQHLMTLHGTPLLSPAHIRDGWQEHINSFIWVSNARARDLMSRGVLPPATGYAAANQYRLAIDAQLTTEFFGMFAPGMPHVALRLADLPIRTTAAGHAAHASQFYVVLYSLATQADPSWDGRTTVIWLTQRAREYLPPTSKARDIVTLVLDDFLANPDPDDWERTRDLIDQHLRVNAAQNGYVYRGWTESSINFASGLLALLYGQGDYRRTVQIGTLSGWDSDNGTATMGGLLGLMLGYGGVMAQFNNGPRENYWISRTRDNMPDYTGPGDNYEDTFLMIADRALPIVRGVINSAGGRADDDHDVWLLPPALTAVTPLQANPLTREHARSANNTVRDAGGIVTASVVVGSGTGTPPSSRGRTDPAAFADGLETGFLGREENDSQRLFYTSQSKGVPPSGLVTLQVVYDRAVPLHAVRFVEGDHFTTSPAGGWFISAAVEALIGGEWTHIGDLEPASLDPDTPFQIFDLPAPGPGIEATGVRIIGAPGGGGLFVTCTELDALGPPAPDPATSYDINADGRVTIEDLYTWEQSPADLNGDGQADTQDRDLLLLAIRWREPADISPP
ncbi:MAG: ADP-ribosylglycohydrolase family protein [Phycisphaeraceae bacterium]|nr:ADP-ribosylglycohydrolase family protein [Phycisphaeraceae bacterium]